MTLPEDKQVLGTSTEDATVVGVPSATTQAGRPNGKLVSRSRPITQGAASDPSKPAFSNISIDDSGHESESIADSKSVPHFFKQELSALLDETMGELVALEDFNRKVDDQAFENEWFGNHTELSLAAMKAEHLRKGTCTAHVDGAGILLSDPEEYRLAVKFGVRITLCVHGERSDDERLEFVLRSQAGKRILSYEEQRVLTNRLIEVQLRLGVDYNEIAKMAGVHPNTVRNVETRASADDNSKPGITKKDRRIKASTAENIAEANRLRAEGKTNSQIATLLDTSPATVAKWFQPPAEPAGKKAKTVRDTSATQSTDVLKAFMANEGIPKVHRLAVEHLKQDQQTYAERLKACEGKAHEAVDAVSDSIDEILNLSLYGAHLRAAAEWRLRQLLAPPCEASVEASPPSDSLSDAIGTVLLGTVLDIEPDGVYVVLPVGSGVTGVIDNRNNRLATKGPLERGKLVRVRIDRFDSERDLWDLTLLGQQTFARAERARAVRHDLDDRCKPSDEVADLKPGPKGKEDAE